MADGQGTGYTAEPEFTLGEARLQTTRGFDFFYVGAETTMEQLKSTVGSLIERLDASCREGRVTLRGPLTFVYLGDDPNGPFTLQAGYWVEAGTGPSGDAQVRHLEDFRCVSVVYTGGLQHIGPAWEAVMRAVGEKGLKPTRESREIYLLFEGDASPNNVTLLQMGVQMGVAEAG